MSGEEIRLSINIAHLEITYESFSERLNGVAGTDNITTLQIQVMDITKDLNRQYRGFAENNEEDGVVFSYLNSKSETGEQENIQVLKEKVMDLCLDIINMFQII